MKSMIVNLKIKGNTYCSRQMKFLKTYRSKSIKEGSTLVLLPKIE